MKLTINAVAQRKICTHKRGYVWSISKGNKLLVYFDVEFGYWISNRQNWFLLNEDGHFWILMKTTSSQWEYCQSTVGWKNHFVLILSQGFGFGACKSRVGVVIYYSFILNKVCRFSFNYTKFRISTFFLHNTVTIPRIWSDSPHF